MRFPSSEFNFTFSTGPSFEGVIFTPSHSQSSSPAGSRPGSGALPSASSRSASPVTPGHIRENPQGLIFGGQIISGTRLFSGSDFAPVAGPSTDSNLAPRVLSSRPKIVPDHSLASNRTREPGALPIPTASHTSMFGNRVRETGSLSSHTETGSVRVFPTTRGIDNLENEGTPGLSASPVNNLENEDEDEAEDDDEDEEVGRVGDDLFSPDPIDDPNLQNDLNAIKVQLQELARTIHDSPLSRDPTTRLHQIRQETKKLSEFKDQETRIVGFIGETGTGECFLLFTLIWTQPNRQAGKSSVINSILDQRGLARSVCIQIFACRRGRISNKFVSEWRRRRMYLCAHGVSICG